MKNLILVILFTIASLVGFSQSTPTLKQVANSGNTAFKKLLYNDNYAGSATGRWLTDKNYVDSLFTVILPGGGISAIVGTSPISVTGGATPTVSITNPIPLANGGTNASLTASDGALFYSTSTNGALSNTSKLFWDYTNSYLGINKNSGLTAPLSVASTTTTSASLATEMFNSAGTSIFKLYGSGQISLGTTADGFMFIGAGSGLNRANNATNNTGVGVWSLKELTSGFENTAIGSQAQKNLVSGINNTSVGYASLTSNTSGRYNTSVGSQSMIANLTGDYNTAVGLNAGYLSTGNYNSYWGYNAGNHWTGSNRTFIQAGQLDSAITIDGNNGQFNITNGHIKIVDGSQGNGKVLTSDANGLGTWTTDPSTGTVTNIATGTGLTGGPISSTGTISISTVPVANGGTNLTSYTIGDILYASGATTLSKLAGVVSGNALISGGVATAPSWSKIGLTTHVSGILPLANGGTNTSIAASNGSVIYSDASKYAMTNVGTAGQLLQSNGATAPSFVSNITPTTINTTSVNITTSAVTNPISLNIANHGDNSTSVNSTGALITSDQALTSTGIDVSATSIDGGVANAITASAVNTNSTGYNNGIGAFASGAKYNTGASVSASGGTNAVGLTISASGASTVNAAISVPTGSVGIGTIITPEAQLEIQNTEGLDATLALDADDGDDNTDTWFIKSTTNNDLTFTNHTTKYLNLTSDGRLYGTSIHNNSGSVTGIINQYIASGTYTATVANKSNITGSPTVYKAMWTRLGNVVTVDGSMGGLVPSSSGATSFTISLPPPSVFAGFGSTTDIVGIAIIDNGTTYTEAAKIQGLGNLAQVSWIAVNTAGGICTFRFVYEIL